MSERDELEEREEEWPGPIDSHDVEDDDDQLLDADQAKRVLALQQAKTVLQGSTMAGMIRHAVDPRCLIAVAYFIESGLVPEELLINTVEKLGNAETHKYFTHPEGK